MIFQHTYHLIVTGKKTRTSRLFQWGDAISNITFEGKTQTKVFGFKPGKRFFDRWQVGKTYALQPGRGKKAIGRVEITGLKREDVREISLADANAEGFPTRVHFWDVWMKMHDKKGRKDLPPFKMSMYANLEELEKAQREHLMTRPFELYDAWAITFKLVK